VEHRLPQQRKAGEQFCQCCDLQPNMPQQTGALASAPAKEASIACATMSLLLPRCLHHAMHIIDMVAL
jgi:hypothetical protein